MKFLIWICKSCGSKYAALPKDAKCPKCGAVKNFDVEEIELVVTKDEEKFLQMLKSTPDGFAKAWGYMLYGTFKAIETIGRVGETK